MSKVEIEASTVHALISLLNQELDNQWVHGDSFYPLCSFCFRSSIEHKGEGLCKYDTLHRIKEELENALN